MNPAPQPTSSQICNVSGPALDKLIKQLGTVGGESNE